MKNPNGYGSIAKLSGNRRKPYIIRKTTGYNDKGHPIYKIIGYTTTKEEAMQLLANYNNSPYDVNLHKLTTEQLFTMFAKYEFPKMSASSVRANKIAWKHCKPVYSILYKNLKAFHMQECIDKCSLSPSSKWAIKTVFVHLDKFAMKLDIINKCNSSLITAPPMPESRKQPFTLEEIDSLWNISSQPWVDSVLVLIYMGWRISELLSIKRTDINLLENTITTGTKTKNGKNRIVPIHSRILPFIQNRLQQNSTYLFSITDAPCTTTTYYTFWHTIMQQLNIQHTPHECRHTFRTLLDNAGGNKVCIDLLMGHKSIGTGERVYTHKTIEQLRDTINLLK